MKIQDSKIIESETKSAKAGELAEEKPKNLNKSKAFGKKTFDKSNKNKFDAKFGGKSGAPKSGGKSFSRGGPRGR